MFLVRSLALVLVVLLLAGCVPVGFTNSITGSGRTVTKDFDLAGFTKVDAGSAFEVAITSGDNYSVAVTVDDNLVDHLDVTKSGDTLRIHLKPSLSIRNTTMKARVTLPVLTGLNLSGATRTTVVGFDSAKSLDVQVSGASTLRGDIKSGDARFDVSGASKVELQGSADGLNTQGFGRQHGDAGWVSVEGYGGGCQRREPRDRESQRQADGGGQRRLVCHLRRGAGQPEREHVRRLVGAQEVTPTSLRQPQTGGCERFCCSHPPSVIRGIL